jgi:ABC-type molybdenum transport system ATPase subunit/photorepair protein PhrA
MIFNPASRWIVIGNSGSGKSTLAERVTTVMTKLPPPSGEEPKTRHEIVDFA